MRFSLRTLIATVTSAAVLAAVVLAWLKYNEPSRVYRRTSDAEVFDSLATVGSPRQRVEEQLGSPNLTLTARHLAAFRRNLSTLPSGPLRPTDTLVAYKRIDIPKRAGQKTANSVGVLVYRNDVLIHRHHTHGYPADLLIDGPLRIRERPTHPEFDKAEMDRAIRRARAEMEGFIAELERGTFSGYGVKTRIRDGDKVEEFWIADVTYADDRFTGTIQNEAALVGVVEIGDTWVVKKDEVIDWTYLREGKIYGNYTLRPLLATMPDAEAKQWRSWLATP